MFRSSICWSSVVLVLQNVYYAGLFCTSTCRLCRSHVYGEVIQCINIVFLVLWLALPIARLLKRSDGEHVKENIWQEV